MPPLSLSSRDARAGSPVPASSGDRVELDVVALASDGRGVARLDGMTVFCEGALPGQRVSATVTALRRRFAEAEATDVLSPSPDERDAPCPHADACGGCPWQRLPEPVQRHWKTVMVRDALTRIGRIDPSAMLPIAPSPSQFGYRNKMAFVFGMDVQGTIRLGQRAWRAHDVTDIVRCPMQDEETDRILRLARLAAGRLGLTARMDARPDGCLRHLVVRRTSDRRLVELIVNPRRARETASASALCDILRDEAPIDGIVLSARSNQTDAAVGERIIRTSGATTLTETLRRNPALFPDGAPGSLTLEFPHDAFFQINTPGAEILYNEVAAMLGRVPAEDVWDLYCGVGGIGLFLAPLAGRLFGIELLPSAIGQARANARRAGFPDAEFLPGDAPEALDLMRRHGITERSLVIVDPPRAGLSPRLLRGILGLRPGRLVYVSCNPATLARDLGLLKDRFSIDAVRPVDMFPQTRHVETVCLCTARRH